jgi:hypothetical protein
VQPGTHERGRCLTVGEYAAVRVTKISLHPSQGERDLADRATGARLACQDRRHRVPVFRRRQYLRFLDDDEILAAIEQAGLSPRGTVRERSDASGRRLVCFAARREPASLSSYGQEHGRLARLFGREKKPRARCWLFEARTKLGYSAAVRRHRNIRARRDSSRSQCSGSNRPDIRCRSGRHK